MRQYSSKHTVPIPISLVDADIKNLELKVCISRSQQLSKWTTALQSYPEIKSTKSIDEAIERYWTSFFTQRRSREEILLGKLVTGISLFSIQLHYDSSCACEEHRHSASLKQYVGTSSLQEGQCSQIPSLLLQTRYSDQYHLLPLQCSQRRYSVVTQLVFAWYARYLMQ